MERTIQQSRILFLDTGPLQKTNHKITEAESMRLATAFVNGADCILTECANFRSLTDSLVVTLDEL